jgi:hypothetical protein
LAERFTTIASITPDDKYVWSVFKQEIIQCIRDLNESDEKTRSAIRIEMIVPFGSRGVLLLGAKRPRGARQDRTSRREIVEGFTASRLTELYAEHRPNEFEERLDL